MWNRARWATMHCKILYFPSSFSCFLSVSPFRKSIRPCHGLIMCVVRDDHLSSQLYPTLLCCHFRAKFAKVCGVLYDMSPQWFSSTWVGSKHLYPCSFRLFRSCLWMAFWIIQISVCISRVFIATHFPHQVILGLFAGEWLVTVFFLYIKTFPCFAVLWKPWIF